ncbi:hypothetical protein ABT213_21840 [Streptomyces sp. NPDC001674]
MSSVRITGRPDVFVPNALKDTGGHNLQLVLLERAATQLPPQPGADGG